MEKFENRLNEALNMKRMRPAELAQRLGVHRGSVSNWLSGRYKPNSVTTDKIAEILDVSTTWLLGYSVPVKRIAFIDPQEDVTEAIKIAYLNADEKTQRIVRELLDI